MINRVYRNGNAYDTCACGREKKAKSGRCMTCRRGIDIPFEPPSHPAAIASPDPLALSFETAWAEFARYIGQAQTRYQPPESPYAGGRRDILVASDLHIPFHDPEMVATMLAREGGRDLLILGGDVQDFYSVSRFVKYEHIPFERELAEVTAFLELVASRFGEVLIVEGNHDKPRFEKQLRERLSEEMVKVIEFLAGGELSVIALLAKRYPNVRVARHAVGSHQVGWFTQEGDLLVSHMEKFSRVAGSTLRGVEEWFADFEDVIGLTPDWRVILQAHTHAMSWFPYRARKLLAETGCLCQTHGYQLTPRAGGRPQRHGYITLTQDDGRTDLNSVRPVWLDAEIAL